MAPMREVRDQAKKVLEEGDPAGALKILQDKINELEALERYDYMAMWALLDDQVPCLEALGDHEAIKQVRARQAEVALEHDAQIATGEIRAHHPVTDAKKDLPSRDRRPPPKPEDYRRD
jgi:predicted subunit of tRNA(5-methylaminomethyl-2-thiouridylate) methyltransferase